MRGSAILRRSPPAVARIATDDDTSATVAQHHHDGHRPSINAAKCPRVVNGSLTGSEHHRSRSEGTLRRHRSNHDASSPRRDRAPASSARPSPIPHRVRDRITTPSSRRLREQIPKFGDMEAGDDRRQAARQRPGSAATIASRRAHRQGAARGGRLPAWTAPPSTRQRRQRLRRPQGFADGIASSRHHHVERASVTTAAGSARQRRHLDRDQSKLFMTAAV